MNTDDPELEDVLEVIAGAEEGSVRALEKGPVRATVKELREVRDDGG